MWDRIWGSRSQVRQQTETTSCRAGRRSSRQPLLEVLEDRQLMASLQSISNVTVPSLQGYTQPLLAASGFTDPQTFTVTSSNPAIAASIAQGQFWTINVSDPTDGVSGPLTFQLFNSVTPTTATNIETFTNAPDSFYNGTFINRVASDFPGATDYVVQGGSQNRNGTNTTNPSGVPFANENFQQLAFTGADQLAMANGGATTPTNGTQFFITTGQPNAELGYNYTIFGQMVTGQATLGALTQIPVQSQTPNGNGTTEISYPVNPVNITTATLSSTNPNGVLILDTTQATQGETSTITVTATDSTDHTTMSQSFVVTVGSYAGPSGSSARADPNHQFQASRERHNRYRRRKHRAASPVERPEYLPRLRRDCASDLCTAIATCPWHGQQLQRVNRHLYLYTE